jgi:hypothetical protein
MAYLCFQPRKSPSRTHPIPFKPAHANLCFQFRGDHEILQVPVVLRAKNIRFATDLAVLHIRLPCSRRTIHHRLVPFSTAATLKPRHLFTSSYSYPRNASQFRFLNREFIRASHQQLQPATAKFLIGKAPQLFQFSPPLRRNRGTSCASTRCSNSNHVG